MNMMTNAAAFTIPACGAYGYKIDSSTGDPSSPPPAAPPPPPPPPQGCPDPYPNILTDGGAEKLEAWVADPRTKCDRCLDGKFDFCADDGRGGKTCQCTAKECTDKGQYVCLR